MDSISNYKEEIWKGLNSLSSEKVKEILDFVYFIKAKDFIDPSQAYFWTCQWQDMEKEAEKDKQEKNTIGDGTVEDLVQELKNEDKGL